MQSSTVQEDLKKLEIQSLNKIILKFCLIGGLILLFSGVIFFVAANYYKITFFQKIIFLYISILGCCSYAVYKGVSSKYSKLALFAASVLVGPLLALYWQHFGVVLIAHEFFSAWFIFCFVMFILAPSNPLIILCWVLFTAAGFTYFSTFQRFFYGGPIGGYPISVLFLLICFVPLIIYEATILIYKFLAKEFCSYNVLPRLAASLIVLLCCVFVLDDRYNYNDIYPFVFFYNKLFIFSCIALLCWFYFVRLDIFILSIAIIPLLIKVFSFLIRGLDINETSNFISVMFFISSSLLFFYFFILKRIFEYCGKKIKKEELKFSKSLTAISSFPLKMLLIASLAGLVALFLGDSSRYNFIVCFIFAIPFSYASEDSWFAKYFSAALAALSVIYFVVEYETYISAYSFEMLFRITLLLFAIFIFNIKNSLIRFFSFFLILFFIILLINYSSIRSYIDSLDTAHLIIPFNVHLSLMLPFIILVAYKVFYTNFQKATFLKDVITSIYYASLSYLLFSYFSFYLADIFNIQIFISKDSFYLFNGIYIVLRYELLILMMLVLIRFRANIQYLLPLCCLLALAFVASYFSFYIAAVIVLLYLEPLNLSRIRSVLLYFVLCVFIVFDYYDVTTLLTYKSFVLSSFGAALLALYFTLGIYKKKYMPDGGCYES